MLKGIANAFRIPELRQKLLLTAGILLLYRFGAYLPVPGVPFQDMLSTYQAGFSASGAMAVLNLFSGGALSRMSVFSLGIMPYITAQIILQLLQAVIPSLGELAKEGEAGQRKITQYTRYLTIGLALLNSIGYLFLFRSYGVSFQNIGAPELLVDIIVVFTMVVGAIVIMWLGEIITQRGVGNGMSLIIFANIMSGIPTALISSVTGAGNIVLTLVTLVVIVAIIPLIVYVERGQRRIPIQYAKRVVGRRMMGGQSTYLPIKVNTAGVVPIIFASAPWSSSSPSRTSTRRWCSTPPRPRTSFASRAASSPACAPAPPPPPTSRARSITSPCRARCSWPSSPWCRRSSSRSPATPSSRPSAAPRC